MRALKFLFLLLFFHLSAHSQCVVGTAIPAAPAACSPAGSTEITSTTSGSPTLINSATTYYTTGTGIKYGALDLSTGPTVINVCSGSVLDLITYSLNTSNVTINVLAGGTLRTSTIERYTLNIYGNVITKSDIYLQNSPTIHVASSGIFQVYPYSFNATSTAGKIYNEGTIEVDDFYLNSVPNPFICMNNSGCVRVRGLVTNNDNSSNPIQAGTSKGFFNLDQTVGVTLNSPITNDVDVAVCLKTASSNFCKGPASAPCTGSDNLFNGGVINPASCTGGGGSKCNNPLPIVLTSLSLSKTQEGIRLSWVASKSEDTDYFMVEVSKDGYSWSEIGTVTPTVLFDFEEFSFYDPTPRNNFYYYRLTEISKSGNRSNSVMGGIDLTNFESSVFVLSNPATQTLLVQLNEMESARMNIYDISGRVLLSGKVVQGQNEIPLSQFDSGVYLVTLYTRFDSITKKIQIYK